MIYVVTPSTVSHAIEQNPCSFTGQPKPPGKQPLFPKSTLNYQSGTKYRDLPVYIKR